MKAMAKEPAHRHQMASELATALRTLAQEQAALASKGTATVKKKKEEKQTAVTTPNNLPPLLPTVIAPRANLPAPPITPTDQFLPEITCSVCQYAIDVDEHDSIIICPNCSTEFRIEGHICPYCHTYHDEETAFCHTCGEAIDVPEPT